MKKYISFLVFCACFVLNIFIFGDYAFKLISLKMENEKTTGTITNLKDLGGKYPLLKIEYDYDYMGKMNNNIIKVSNDLLKKIYIRGLFSGYYVGQRVSILIKPDNSFSFLKNELDSEIFRKIFNLLLLPLLITYIVTIYLFKNNLTKKNKKAYYKYYIQNNNHKIKESNIGEKISLDDIIKNIDYAALKNGDIICCGIEKDGDFVEISYSENKCQLRIFKNGKEKIETTDDGITINDIVYNHIKMN